MELLAPTLANSSLLIDVPPTTFIEYALPNARWQEAFSSKSVSLNKIFKLDIGESSDIKATSPKLEDPSSNSIKLFKASYPSFNYFF